MGDIWNPFDNNNPVYGKLAKELKSTRRIVKNTALILGGLAIVLAVSQNNNSGFFGKQVNQFGVIRRK